MAFETSLPPDRQRGLIALTLVLGIAALILAVGGQTADPRFAEIVERDGGFSAWSSLLFNAGALLVLNQPADPPTNLWFDLARLTALGFASVAVFTILLMLSRAFAALTGRVWIGWRSLARPRKAHAIIFGLGYVGLQIVRDLRTKQRRHVIVVEPEVDHPNFDEARRLGALVLHGNPLEHVMRRRARLHLAQELFITAGDDALNIELAGQVLRDFRDGSLARPRRFLRQEERQHRHLQCYLHSTESELSEIFRAHDLLEAKDEAVDVHLFNVNEQAARQLMLDETQGLSRTAVPDRDETAHYAVYGFGAAGQAIALQLGRLAHFPNMRRLRLTVIDNFELGSAAERGLRAFLGRYPAFCPDPATFDLDSAASYIDDWQDRSALPFHGKVEAPGVEYAVNAEFLDMRTEASDPHLLGSLLRRIGRRRNVKAAVIVCFDADRRNLSTAFHLLDRLECLETSTLRSVLPIYVHLAQDEGLANLIQERTRNKRIPLYAFGQRSLNAGYAPAVRPLLRTLARGFQRVYDPRTPYEDLGPSFKASVEDAAAHAVVKLHSLGFRIHPLSDGEASPDLKREDRERLAGVEHNRWMAERLIAGWRYEPHPPGFDELSDEEQGRIHMEMGCRKRRASLVPWEVLNEKARVLDRTQVDVLIKALAEARHGVAPFPDVENRGAGS